MGMKISALPVEKELRTAGVSSEGIQINHLQRSSHRGHSPCIRSQYNPSVSVVPPFVSSTRLIHSTMCNTTSIPDDPSPVADVPVAMIESTESASIVAEEEVEEQYLDGVEKLIYELAHSNNTKINAALDALLKLDLNKYKKKCDKTQAVAGCFALVNLRDCQDKATGEVTKVNEKKSSSRFRNIFAHFASLALVCALVIGAGVCLWHCRRLAFADHEGWFSSYNNKQSLTIKPDRVTQCNVTRATCDFVLPTSTSSNSCEICGDASPPMDAPAAMSEKTESDSHVVEDPEEEDLDGVEKLIQDLAHSDNATVNTALNFLSLLLDTGKEKCDAVTAWGGCAALVHLLKVRLKTAMKNAPSCGQVTELNEIPELATIKKALGVIAKLSLHSRDSIVAVGGVAAVVKTMNTFPKCQMLQEHACDTLNSLAGSNGTGKEQAIESDGIEVLLAAINNHLGSAILCQNACSALLSIVRGSKENTRLLISLGGGAVVTKVKTKWPNNFSVQSQARRLANLIVWEMKAYVDEDEMRDAADRYISYEVGAESVAREVQENRALDALVAFVCCFFLLLVAVGFVLPIMLFVAKTSINLVNF